MFNGTDGIILIDKNAGETSFDVVKRAKRVFKIKSGHAGTLDPFATGLLIILLGQGTKLSNCLMAGKKKYLAVMTLGIKTDTLDGTGRVLVKMPVHDMTREEVECIIREFRGDIEQRPPAYSAVNYKGQRAYKLARKGIEVDLGKRMVTIHSIEIVSVNLPEITFEVICSGGTYIRSLAADIGERLGSVAHLKSLRRISSGSFSVLNALDSRLLESGAEGDVPTDRIIPLIDALPDVVECPIDPESAKKIANGIWPGWDEPCFRDVLPDDYKGYIKLTNCRSLIALLETDRGLHDNRAWLKSMRVFI